MSELGSQPSVAAGQALVALAREAVRCHLEQVELTIPPDVGDAFAEPAGAFVTIRYANGQLRGCVGSARPYSPTVAEEVARVAPLAATGDHRFPNVSLEELPGLVFDVSVLTPLEQITNPADLDPHRYGITIRDFHNERSALLLPGIPGIETVDRQLYEIRRKAGIPPGQPIRIWRFEIDKYAEPR